jgi:hypothetical protein
MSKAAAKRRVTTTPAKNDLERAAQEVSAKQMFWSSALDMGWQLAVVVLLPVFIGVKLDHRYDTAPSCTLAALFIAIGGACWVVYSALKSLNAKQDKRKSK